MRRVCFYHAGCPDGFGAAWAVWRAWGSEGVYQPRGHDDALDAWAFEGDEVVFVDIAPPNRALHDLSLLASRIVVLDHHISSQKRFESDEELTQLVSSRGHEVVFKLGHSGAVLAWQHFGGAEPVPELLHYVEDQDLWNWRLPDSEEVNAAIGSHPRRFDVWDWLASRPLSELAHEGESIVRANRVEVEHALNGAHGIRVDGARIEAVNATSNRSRVGHRLAERARYEKAWGCVYRVVGGRVDASLYSIGDLDVSTVASRFGGGGHRNAAGFSVPLERWLRDFA